MTATGSMARPEDGMTTAEYAMGTVAACGFACVLLQLLVNWRALLLSILLKVLEVHFGWPSWFPL